MKRVALSFIAVALAVAWASGLLAQAPPYRVIVHPDNPVTSLTKDNVSELLLKKTTTWSHGGEVVPIDLDAASSIREAFSLGVHGRTVASIKNFWQRQIFSGRDVPPPEVRTENEVIEFVADNPGAIGYVSSATSLNGVKAVAVTQ